MVDAVRCWMLWGWCLSNADEMVLEVVTRLKNANRRCITASSDFDGLME